MANRSFNLQQLQRDLTDIFGEQVDVDLIDMRQLASASIAIVNMRYERVDRSNDGTTRTISVRQTAVILRDPELDLPQFTLSPKAGGIIGSVFNLLGSVGAVDFSDTPGFAKQYHFHGWNEQACRVLMTPMVREAMGAIPGWSVRGQGNQLVVFHQNKICASNDLNAFVNQSLQWLQLFQEGEEQLDARPDIRRETRPEDMVAASHRATGLAGGMIGAMLRKQLNQIAISPEELESFASSNSPREIPPGMKRQVVGDNFMLVIVGAMFFVVGVFATIATFLFASPQDRWITIPFGIVFPLVGGSLVFFTLRYRRRKKRALCDGRLVSANVMNVKGTNTTVNNQRRYHAVLEFTDQGNHRSVRTNIYGPAVEIAEQRQRDEQPIRVLVDPVDPQHVVCLDLLTIFASGD